MNHRLPLLLLCLALVSCTQSERISPLWDEPVKIDPSTPPEGMYLLQILLENQSLPLKGTGCEGPPGDRRRLQHRLALTLGSGIDDPRHYRVLSGKCEAVQFELRSGSVIDAWNCVLGGVEKDKKGDPIASSHIDFGIKKDTWEIIPETLRCM